ncbi:hypothetical protein [Nocardia takedensis]|uniref:hypothetical protein n=1 Tax=Nocardia takedensis TaxID=259390 RepID=UPI0003156D9F|nr:hypothetical protein [Nocardia takedensis]
MSTDTIAGPRLGGVREQLPVPGICDIPLGPQQACQGIQLAEDVANSAYDKLVDVVLEGFARTVRIGMAWWTNLPSPQLSDGTSGPGPVLSAVREYSGGLQVLFLTAGIMFAAARLALAKRGGVAGEAQESFLMLGRASFLSMAIAVLVTTGTRAGDNFSNWVIFEASEGDWLGAVDRITAFDQNRTTVAGLGTGILIVVGTLGLVSSLLQLVMLVVRQALLILVVAVIPIAAAAAGTGPGSQAYKKLVSWTVAFVLYKPVGGLVYAVAFTVIGDQKQTDSQQVLLGLILLVMSVLILPALMRLVAPAVATLGGGGGATAVLAGGAAGVAMGSAGERGSARKLSEGEDAANGTGPAGGANPGGGNNTGGGGGGGGRPLGGGGESDSSPAGAPGGGKAGSGTSSTSGGGASRSGAPSGRASSPGEGAPSGGGSEAGGGAGGGAVLAGHAVKAAGEQAVSEAGEQTREAAEGGGDPDSLSPGEVRR